MNLPPHTREILRVSAPPDDAILTGPELVESVLRPLAESACLRGCVHQQHRVVAVGRAGLTRSDLPGHPIRAERPFRLLVDTPRGEQTFEAESVIDASGTYGQPVALGAGGLPCTGERSTSAKFIRNLGQLNAAAQDLRGKRLLLIAHGHSAANAIQFLSNMASESAGTKVTWATRSLNQRPCVEVFADPLPERQQVVAYANQLAAVRRIGSK